MSPMLRRHVGVGRAVATHLGTARMAGHAATSDEDLDRARGDADIGPLADELIGNAVVVALDLEVVVDADLGPLPGRELVWPVRQRLQGRSVDRLEDAASAAFELSEGPVVQPFDRSAIAALASAIEKNVRLRRAARIQRSATWTPTSTLALSRGLRERAGMIAVP